MSGSAQVRSTEAIESFRGALEKFESRSQDALETLAAELRRASLWLEHECPAYWKKQAKLAEDEVHQTKLDLERCLIFPIAGERPACREEKAALKKARLRVEYCREKGERVKHWNRQLQHELFEYEGRVGHLKRLLETDLPVAQAKLQQIVRRLDEYQIERPPESSEHEKRLNPETAKEQSFPEKNSEKGMEF